MHHLAGRVRRIAVVLAAEHVEQLQNLTLTTATTSQIKNDLLAIKGDLSTIAGARGDLSEQVEQALKQLGDSYRRALAKISCP